MIALAYDCLLFETSSGESIPFSAEMISVELTDDGIGAFDPEFLKHAASAVFHYFKHDLGRITVTVGEFAGALEKVLRGFGLESVPDDEDSVEQCSSERRVLRSDLRKLACESGKGFELVFFPRLRDELRQQLLLGPEVTAFSRPAQLCEATHRRPALEPPVPNVAGSNRGIPPQLLHH